MNTPKPVLISWIAVENDPFNRRDLERGQKIPGPTLTLLFDDESPYAGRIQDVVLLHRKSDGEDDAREQRAIKATLDELKQRNANLHVHLEPWTGTDPTDHRGIFEFLRNKIPQLRKRFAGSELILHISPGTPSMQTIWVLMAETGFIEKPFQMVKSYRQSERRGRPPVVPVEVGIDTFYKVYKATRPSLVASEEEAVAWDPAKFRTERMRKLFAEARRFAQIKVPVLILGERGTGKSTLADWIRLHSPYRKETLDSHWPAVACGQYNSETMRSELFGYKKGAFTGANSDKDGILVAAHGDTLFLDEIGDVSRDLQRLLIKAIEEKKYFPLGTDAAKKSDFRLISATNLEDDELKRRLDPDFRDRVSLLTLRLPPLREIREELGWLWESSYQVATTRAGTNKRQVQFAESHHKYVVSKLQEHQLPGNMRDLLRVAYRIVAARNDAHDPLSPVDAVEYGLIALSERSIPLMDTTSRLIARAFADTSPLDSVIVNVGRISTKDLERDLRMFLATEIRRFAKSTSRPIDDLCDVTDRSLRTWANQKE